MGISLIRLVSCMLLALALSAHAELPAPVLQALQVGGVPADAVSLYVQRVDQPQPLLAHRADASMNPASSMKLLTTYAGLELLGPAYTWRTEAYASTPVQDGVLHGDLILKGYGDPALTLEHFWNLLRSLRRQGLREIRGNLVLDRSYFEATAFDPGAFDGEPYRAYNAGPDALLVNFNATRFLFAGATQGGRVRVTADPALPHVRIVNQLRVSDEPCADWKNRLDYQLQRAPQTLTLTFAGSYARDCGDKELELSLPDASQTVFQLFKLLWQEQGGLLLGQLQEGSVPAGALLLGDARSPPLAEVVRLINKNSNNVMARQLLISIGAERLGAPGSAERGSQALRAWLTARGMEFPELVLENGAGLSRSERISARHLGELLLAAYASPVMPELMSSLPVVAVDGTLKKRLQGSPVAGRAHLKSGSLDGVRSLAGYVLDAAGRRWVVVLLVNHAVASNSRPAQEVLLQWLYQHD
jgi:D-alanyl-D-alanine carboxypeptidase/D-alanyl-D-alanine-endopeptidase (penicillin-binding protein 4)